MGPQQRHGIGEFIASAAHFRVGGPQVSGLGVPVEADDVAHARQDGLCIAAVQPHAADLSEAYLAFADVAGRGVRQVGHVTRSDPQIAPALGVDRSVWGLATGQGDRRAGFGVPDHQPARKSPSS